MAQIAMIGPGAIGGTVAARLCQSAAHTVTLCARSQFTHLTIDAPARILTATPEILLSPERARPVNWVLVATKAYDVPSAAAWLQRLLGPATRVAVLQNGVEHVERFKSYVPEPRIVPVIVDIPVERRGPGHFWQRANGHLTVAAESNGEAFAGLFAHSGLEIRTTTDLRSAAWRKLAVNCAGAVSALVLKPSSIAHRDPVADIMRALVRECIEVARAEGAELDGSLPDAVVDGYRNGPGDGINSLHADRLAGRPMETDARNGAVVRFGRKHGIATPVNQIIVALLEATA